MFSAPIEWAPEGKQNFTFGAKTSSCLPSAYSQDVLASAGFDLLSEWDQSGLVGLGDHVELVDGAALCTETFEEASMQQNFFNAHMEADDADLLRTMKTEDMMIPLSEMVDEEVILPKIPNTGNDDFCFVSQPAATSLPIVIQPPTPATSPPPKRKKITITVRTVKKPCLAPVPIKIEKRSPPPIQVQPLDSQLTHLSETDVLLDELVRMVEKEEGSYDFLNIDSSMVEENMNDLLAQLEDPTKTQQLAVKTENNMQCVNYLITPPAAHMTSQQASPYHSDESCYPTDLESAASSPRSTVDTSVIDSVVTSPASVIDQYISSSEETLDDPEYSAESCHTYTRKRAPRGRRANAGKPYPEGRKERKKEQNKQAALRYRQKKKQEEDDFMGKIRAEEDRKKELTKQYNNIKQELSCMKKIMREVFIAKGLISPEAFKKLTK